MKLSSGSLIVVLLTLSLAGILAMFIFLDPIPQSQDYHCFADAQSFLGIANFWNVISNLGFVWINSHTIESEAFCFYPDRLPHG